MQNSPWLSAAAFAAFLIGAVPQCPAEDAFRLLESSDGRTIKARVLAVADGNVDLVREDGKRFTIPLEKFSAAEQERIKAGGPAGGGAPDHGIAPGGGNENKKLYPRSQSEINATLAEIRIHADSQKDFSEDERNALAVLNGYRYLSGLSYDLDLDRKLCDAAAKAGEACEKLGRLDHGANPEAGKCNLNPSGSLPGSIHAYFKDGGESNREHRAHRAWCLSPSLGKLGTGAGPAKRMSGMWTMDKSGSSRIKGGFFAYPAPGYFPEAYLHKDTAWTVYFPGASLPDKDKLEVKVWRLPNGIKATYRPGEEPDGGREVEIKYVSLSQWVTPCVNFEPVIERRPGEPYWVSIDGGDFKAAYLVEFMGSL